MIVPFPPGWTGTGMAVVNPLGMVVRLLDQLILERDTVVDHLADDDLATNLTKTQKKTDKLKAAFIFSNFCSHRPPIFSIVCSSISF